MAKTDCALPSTTTHSTPVLTEPAGAKACYDMLSAIGSIDFPEIAAPTDADPDTVVWDCSELDNLLGQTLDRYGHTAGFRQSLANYLHMSETCGNPQWGAWDARMLHSYAGSRPAPPVAGDQRAASRLASTGCDEFDIPSEMAEGAQAALTYFGKLHALNHVQTEPNPRLADEDGSSDDGLRIDYVRAESALCAVLSECLGVDPSALSDRGRGFVQALSTYLTHEVTSGARLNPTGYTGTSLLTDDGFRHVALLSPSSTKIAHG